jgi:hypothetical protein
LLASAIKETKIEEKIKEIESMSSPEHTAQEIHEKLENIDTMFTKMRLTCERQSKTKHRHPWSPALQKASRRHNFWNILVSQIRLGKDFSHILTKYADEETMEYIKTTPSINFVRFKLNQSRKRLKEIQNKAPELCRLFLKEKARMHADFCETKMEKIVKRIKTCEFRNSTVKRLGLLKEKQHTALEFLLVSDSDNNEVRIDDASEVQEKIKDHNIIHFSQADDTEFASEPLKSFIGQYGTAQGANDILSGTANIPPDASEAAKAIISFLKRDQHSEIDDTITANDLITVYRKWGEFTTTSPSGLHLSHDKAVLKYSRQQKIEAAETDSSPLFETVFAIKAKIIQLSIDHGYVYERWKPVINAMIEKATSI